MRDWVRLSLMSLQTPLHPSESRSERNLRSAVLRRQRAIRIEFYLEDRSSLQLSGSFNSGRALHARKWARKPQSVPARAKRKRSWLAVLSGKIDDNLACLCGAVSGGAEETKHFFLRSG